MKVNEVSKMTTWFDELKDEVEVFFGKANDEEIHAALEKANYSYYKKIDVPILSMNSGDEAFVYKEIVSIAINNDSYSADFSTREFNFDEFLIADDNSFEYNTAA